MNKVLRSVCPHDCPDTCGIISHVDDDKLVKVKGDPGHFVTRGFLCKKVMNYPERVYSPDRVLYPLKRVGEKGAGKFERISWDEVVDTITTQFKDIINRHCAESILPFRYSGTG